MVCTLFLCSLTLLSVAQKDDEYHLDKVYEMGKTGTLYLSSEDADVEIIGSNRSDARVKIDRIEVVKGVSSGRKSFQMEIERKGDDLQIRERSRGNFNVRFGYSRLEYDILVELPEGASIRVTGEDGDHFVKNVNGKIKMDSEDGDILVQDCKGSDFDFELEDGDLEIEDCSGKLYVESEDGEIKVRNGDFSDLQIETEDGRIAIETALQNGGSYNIRVDDAPVEFVVLNGGGEFSIRKSDASVRASSDFEQVYNSESKSEYKLPGGSADIKIRTEDGRVRLAKR